MYTEKKVSFLALFFSLVILCAHSELSKKKDDVSCLNLQSLDVEDNNFESDDYLVYLNFLYNHQAFPEKRRKRELAFKIFKDQQLNFDRDVFIDTQSLQELELFCGKTEKDKYVGASLDKTKTEMGKVLLYTMLSSPTTNLSALCDRQSLIQEFKNNKILRENLKKLLQKFAGSENFFYSLWAQDGFKRALERQGFFKLPFLDTLDNNALTLEIKNKFDHQRRLGWVGFEIVGTIIALIVGTKLIFGEKLSPGLNKLAKNYKVGDPITQYLERNSSYSLIKGAARIFAGTISALFLKNDLEWFYGCFILEKMVQKKLSYIAQLIDVLESSWKLIKNSTINKNALKFFPELEKFFTTYRVESKKLDTLLNLLKTSTFKGNGISSFYIGRVVLAYKYLHESKEYLAKALYALGELDLFCSLASLLEEHQDLSGAFSFAHYVDAPHPCIKACNFWHPLLDASTVVTNSYISNDEGNARNAIVTGPNAAGKSTILKALALNVLCAQTLGICPARSFVITPFNSIITSFDVVDDLSNGSSLFKNEVLRAEHTLRTISSAHKNNQKCFIALDEMCRGTSPREGTAISYTLANCIGKYDNTIALLATHYELLTSLEKNSDAFKNYKVIIKKQEDGSVIFPFILEAGASTQHSALDIILAQGIENDIVKEARALLDSL